MSTKPEAYARDLTCVYCGGSLPETHSAYSKLSKYTKVKTGNKLAFCCLSHATLFNNAKRTPEQLADIGAKTSAARSKPIPAHDLKCNHCGTPIHLGHKAYKTIGAYNKAKAGLINVFCSLNHAQLYINEHRTHQQKLKRRSTISTGCVQNDSSSQRHETMKNRGSYNQSKPELRIFHKLRRVLPNLEYQYRKREGYPYAADFYDPDSDTIFEYQGFMTHGGAPYDSQSSEHALRVKQLKLRAKTDKWLAKLTLKIWTSSDPQKRAAIRKSNINFVEWFTEEQFETWYSTFLAQHLGSDKSKGLAYKFGSQVLCAYDELLRARLLNKYPDLITFYPWEDVNKVAKLLLPKDVMYARKLEVCVIPNDIADQFCAKYHVQGKCRGTTLSIALVQGHRIIGAMTFGTPRYNKNFDYELLRLCFSSAIVGGSSRMWKLAVSKLGNPSVISYCDLSKFNGNVYRQLGFKLKRTPIPGLHWYNPLNGRHVTDNLLRQRGFDQLVGSKINTVYGKGTNNAELMTSHGFIPVYDEGQATFIYNPI